MLVSVSIDRQKPGRVWSLSSIETRNRINTGEIRRRSQKGLICVRWSGDFPRLIAVLSGMILFVPPASPVYANYIIVVFCSLILPRPTITSRTAGREPCSLFTSPFLRAKQGRRARPALPDQLLASISGRSNKGRQASTISNNFSVAATAISTTSCHCVTNTRPGDQRTDIHP